MFMRLVQAKVDPDRLQTVAQRYEERIIPELQKIPGCLCLTLMQSARHPDECLSMTLWETREDVENYEKSGLYQDLLDEIRPFLSETSAWKIELTKDLKLEYKPIHEEPVVKGFPVVVQTDSDICAREEPRLMHTRIVSIKTRPGKHDEFRELYASVIAPALRNVKGCRYAYLTDGSPDENEALSVTIWDSREDAENYERSGLFDHLTEKVKHTFSELFQWKMALEREPSRKAHTSDDLAVEHYRIVAGRRFR